MTIFAGFKGYEDWPKCKACNCLRPPSEMKDGMCLDAVWCRTHCYITDMLLQRQRRLAAKLDGKKEL